MPPWSRRDFFNLPPRKIVEIVNTVFKEPIYFIVDMIKDDPYLRGLNKMRSNPTQRNQSLYYQYH